MTTPPKRRETVVLTYQGGEPLVVPPGWTVLMPYGNALTKVWPRTPPHAAPAPPAPEPRSTEARSTETPATKTVESWRGTLDELQGKQWGGVGSPVWPGSGDDKHQPRQNVSAGTPAAAREGLGSLAGLPSLEERVLRNIDALVEQRVADARARAEKAVALATALEKKAFAQVVELEIEVANLKKHYDTAIIERDETWVQLAARERQLNKIKTEWASLHNWALNRGSAEDGEKFRRAAQQLHELL